MAVDEALLLDAVDNGTATFRFYEWSEPTLSLGYFQAYADRDQHAASRNCPVVRRQSGGGAILHDHELTYSFVLPPGHPLGRNAPQLYDAVHKAFIAAIGKSESNGGSVTNIRCRGCQTESNAGVEPFLCFQRKSPGDVVLDSQDMGLAAREPSRKVLGSAQRRNRGAILQHGSLLLETSNAAPELPGLGDLTGRFLSVPQLVSAVCTELTTAFNCRFSPYQLSVKLQSKASEIANTRYRTPSWTNRR